MRNKDNKNISDVLKQFSAQKQINTGYNQVSLEKFWKDKMGDMINKYTERLVLKDHVLKVYITSSALKQELNYSKVKIQKMIEGEFGSEYVKEIQIR